jgi:hypothetical protein
VTEAQRQRAYELMTDPDAEDCDEQAAGGDIEPLTEEQVDRLVAAAAAAYRGRPS